MVDKVQKKLHDALDVANRAAQDKKDQVRHLVREQYGYLKDLLSESSEAVAGQVKKGREAARATATRVDEQVHQNPWPYLAGALVSAFLFGLLLGKTVEHRAE